MTGDYIIKLLQKNQATVKCLKDEWNNKNVTLSCCDLFTRRIEYGTINTAALHVSQVEFAIADFATLTFSQYVEFCHFSLNSLIVRSDLILDFIPFKTQNQEENMLKICRRSHSSRRISSDSR